jgi:hypothetical protein
MSPKYLDALRVKIRKASKMPTRMSSTPGISSRWLSLFTVMRCVLECIALRFPANTQPDQGKAEENDPQAQEDAR